MARRYAIRDVLARAVEQLAGAGVADPRREARALWAAVAGPGVKPGDVWLGRDRPPTPDVARRFRHAVRLRRGTGALPHSRAPARPPRADSATGDRRAGGSGSARGGDEGRGKGEGGCRGGYWHRLRVHRIVARRGRRLRPRDRGRALLGRSGAGARERGAGAAVGGGRGSGG